MGEGSTADFFQFIDAQNNAIAAREVPKGEIAGDPFRAKRDAERREKLGELRAREHSSKRPHRARPAFGHIKVNGER